MSPQEMGDLLRTVDFALQHAETALVAFGDRKYMNALERDFERCGRARKLIAAALTDLPPAVPPTPEQEAKVGAFIGAVLDKRFGDGTQEAVDSTLAAWVSSESPKAGT